MKKRDPSDVRDAKLRAEPDYQDLCRLLDRQTDAEKDRLAHELSRSQGCEHSQDPGALTMVPNTRDLDTRIAELKSEGLSFSQVADRLNAEGFTNVAGGKFTRKSVAGRFYRFKEKALFQPRESCEHETEDLKPPVSAEPSQPCESSQYSLPPEIVQAVRSLIREELQARSLEVANLAKADVEMPPPTPKAPGTKRFLGERVTMPGMRIDSALYTAFKQECKGLGLSASNGLQRILWLHYGKPRLSFQGGED